MIKRSYFYSIRWNHRDGSDSYSYMYGIFSTKSWLPIDRNKMMIDQIEYATKDYKKDFPNGKPEVIALNRI